jgi:hypothetical protein
MILKTLPKRERFAHDPAHRGYHAIYRLHQTNHCPGCGRTHWYVGRASAECGFCSTALPFEGAEFAREGWLACA